MVNKLIIFALVIISLIFSTFVVGAEDGYVPDDYYELEDELPEDVEELLPEGIFSPDSDQMSEAVDQAISWNYIVDTVFDMIGMNLGDIARVLAIISIVIVLSSILALIQKDLFKAAILTGISGASVAVLFQVLLAPDVALTQAIVEGAIIPIFIALAVKKTQRSDS